jgi:hypothetical protein
MAVLSSVAGVASANLAKCSGVAKASIAKIIGADMTAGDPAGDYVAYWTFDDDTGADESGNYNGTWTGTPSEVTGKVNGALSLNGNQYMTVTSASGINFQSDFSICFWFKPSDTATAHHISRTNSSQQGYVFYQSGGSLKFGITTSVQFYQIAAPDYTSGNWYHIIGTFSDAGNIIRLYIDNSEQGSGTTVNGVPGTYTLDCIIGANAANTSDSRFNGVLDDIRFYDRVLTSDERADIYELGV